MTRNAGFRFSNTNLSDKHLVPDCITGQTVTLEELGRRRIENQNKIKSKPVSDSIRESNRRIIETKLNEIFDEDFDEDFLPPTDAIFKAVKNVLIAANELLGYEMTIPSFIVLDGEEGIRIEWKLNDKQLRMVVSPERIYLYFESNGHYDGIPNFNAEQLVDKLRWLMTR